MMAELRKLIGIARQDWNAACVLLESELVRDELAGFHLQQAAEKALKVWLSARGKKYPHTHDLRILLEMLEECGDRVEPYWTLLELIPFSVQFRYDLCDDMLDFDEVFSLTSRLIDHVETIVLTME